MDHTVSEGFGMFPGGGGGHPDAFHLGEEIHSLMNDATAPENGNSFTALLGLQPTEALELLHHPDPRHSSLPHAASCDSRGLAFSCLPAFPALAAAKAESPEGSSDPSVSGEILNQLAKVKSEVIDSDTAFNISPEDGPPTANNKRKESSVQKPKVRNGGKKTKSLPESAEPAEQLPYVHVRARRGQATDSHSLAERARREKINVRMKLLQELVPGCSKISGTALVLDEIINHVQSLQRQVEFLSMRLASVNPRIDFGIDGFLSGEFGALSSPSDQTIDSGSFWPELQPANMMAPRRAGHQTQQTHPLWQLGACAVDLSAPSSAWTRDDARAFVSEHESVAPTSILGFDSFNSGDPTQRPLPTLLPGRVGQNGSVVSPNPPRFSVSQARALWACTTLAAARPILPVNPRSYFIPPFSKNCRRASWH